MKWFLITVAVVAYLVTTVILFWGGLLRGPIWLSLLALAMTFAGAGAGAWWINKTEDAG